MVFGRFCVVLASGLALLTAATHAAAQQQPAGAFVSLGVQATTINRGTGVMLSLRGGYRTAGGTSIGAELGDLLNGTPFPDQSDVAAGELRRTKLHTGGIFLGHEFGGIGSWHSSVGALLGVGDVSAYREEKNRSADGSWYRLVQPTVSLEGRAGSRFHPRFDAGWRLVSGARTAGTSDVLLGGPFVGVAGSWAR